MILNKHSHVWKVLALVEVMDLTVVLPLEMTKLQNK
jgi:hypothetical protein